MFFSGLRPKYHAGKNWETKVDFPACGGQKTSRRFISPLSTISNAPAIN
jgi:hypothetical protein